MPHVAEVRESLKILIPQLRAIPGIKNIKVFGSFAEKINEPAYRVKDIDIIAMTPFHSEDLLSVNADMLSLKSEILEEQGFDMDVIKFSKAFTRANELPFDHWALSSDKKLLHWGAIMPDRGDSDEIKQQAEFHASTQTGLNIKKLAKASDDHRTNWYASYRTFLQRQFEHMPNGWYCSGSENVKDIISKAIQLDK